MGNISLFAGGYQINLQGVKQTGMGHCGVSLLEGPSNVFFNPGSLSFLSSKIGVSMGVNGVDARVVYFNTSTGERFRNERRLGTPFSLYLHFKANDKLAFGLGVYTPFGSSLKWEDEWAGRYQITEIALQTIYLQPTVSYRFGAVGVGAGLMIGSGKVELSRDIPIANNDGEIGSVFLSGKGRSVGINVGAFIKVTEELNFGISYRSEHEYNVSDGEVIFNVPETASDQLMDQQFQSGLAAPSNLMVGMSYQFSKKFMVCGEVNFTGWSVYRKLEIDFEQDNSSLEDISDPRLWRDSEVYRLGLVYTPKSWLRVRLGYSKDNSPVNPSFYSPETPDLDRSSFHAGVSVKKDDWELSGAFQWAEGEQIEAVNKTHNFGGAYNGRAFVYSIGIAYEFSK